MLTASRLPHRPIVDPAAVRPRPGRGILAGCALALLTACGGGADGPAPTSPPPPAAPAPPPEPRACTNEREQALAFLVQNWPNLPPQLVEFWDGTPVRVYLDATRIPEAERPHAEHMLAVVARFSEQIEDQLGYPVLEPAGWIDDEGAIEIDGLNIVQCATSEPGRRAIITAIPEHTTIGAAYPACAVAWFQTFVLPADYLGPHELFHLFGFRHSEETHPQERDWGGIPMSRGLTTGVNAAGTDYIAGSGAAFEDIDALGCVLPHPDFER